MKRFVGLVVILSAMTAGKLVASAQTTTGSFAAVPVFGAAGLANAVFTGGSVDQLESAARAVGASGVWVQTADGSFQILVAGGPAFLKDTFKSKSPNGFSGPTAVTLARTPTATAAPAAAAAGSPVRNATDCPENSLRAAATARGFAIGMGGINQGSLYMLRDSATRDTLRCAANIVTANGFYWGTVEPKQDQFNFSQADEMLNYAQANGLAVRGHVLVWHNSLPAWLEGGTFTPEQLKAILRTHIQTIVGHYRGKMVAWDVLNEAIDDKGNLRDTIWLRALGPEYIELSFRWAHEADPDALLFYNEYRNEGAGRVPDRQYELVRELKAKGVPIHGVGMQMHLIQGREAPYSSPATRPAALDAMSANITRLGTLGLTIHITEMDVSVLKLPGDKLAAQAEIYANILRTCLTVPACTALLTWNLDDGHTWLTGRYEGSENDAPLLFDRGLRPKPALDEIRKVLSAR